MNNFYWRKYAWPSYTTNYFAYLNQVQFFYNPVQTGFGSCDCSGYGVSGNNCNAGVPVCAGGNCTCVSSILGTNGCFNTPGAIC